MAQLENITVTAYWYNSETLRYEKQSETKTNALGNYTLKGLKAGDYKLKFEDEDLSLYVTEYFSGKASLLEGDSFAVTDSQAVTGKDLVMTATATIAGTVTDA